MNLIFLLNSTYPCYTGGRETWLYNICQRLCEEHRIFVLSETPYSTSEKENGRVSALDPRITVIHSSNLKNCALTKPFIRSYINCLNAEVSMWSMRRALRKLLRSLAGETCYVISLDTVYMGRIGLWAKKHFPNTVVFINSVRGPHAEVTSKSYPKLKEFFYRRELQSLEGADKIWSNGWDTQETLKKQGFQSAVMKNGINTERAHHPEIVPASFFPQDTKFHLLSIATLLDGKGYREMIQAIGVIKREHGIRVGLTAFGKGSSSSYQKLAEKEGIVDQILFVGHQPKTVEYASGFDLVVCLAGGGGLSMACLESLLSGTPVIAWDSPVYRQMITHGENGWLVQEKDVHSLAEGIIWIMSHKEEASQMGKKARKLVEQFDWSCIANDIVHALGDISK